MKTDAQAHSQEDKKRKEEIDTKNQADNLVFQTRKQLKDLGEKMGADMKAKVESAANALEEAVKANNTADIKTKMDALTAVWNDVSTKMYEAAKTQQQAAGAQPGAGPAPGEQQEASNKNGQSQGDKQQGGKKVEDADFEVMDDK